MAENNNKHIKTYATKDYVDNVVGGNGFSGDYNDLINKPCYDTREHVELLFDNDLTGRETITSEDGNTIYVKLKGDIQPEIIDGISQGTYTLRYFDGSGGWHDETYLVSDFISKINDLPIYKIDDIIVVLEDCFVDTWWQRATSFTNGIWTKYMQNESYYSAYVTTLEYMDSSSGEIKKLDEKFVSYKPGIKPEEGQSITIHNWHTEGSIEATVSKGAEIFNDYKNNFATGECSHAEGRYSNAVGDCSHAEGNENTAEGFAAHAEGYTTSSPGEASHSEGRLTEASGDYSHAEGYWTEASGEISHAEGEWTKASSECQHVQGKYNIEDTENKYAHIVGNGNSIMRSNAHTLDWNGNAWFQGNVSIDGTPTNNNDLVTKQYVDDSIAQASIGGGDVDTTNFALKSELFSKDYNDLTNKPSIPSIEGLASESYVNQQISNIQHPTYDDTDIKNQLANKADKTELHSHTNKTILDDITKDMMTKWDNALPFEDSYVADCNAWLTNGYTKVSASETVNHPSQCTGSDKWGILFFIAENAIQGTGTQMYFPIDGTYKGRVFVRSMTNRNPGTWTLLSTFSGNYNDLTNKPTIPTVPTNISAFNNDSGYITSIPSEYVTDSELTAKGYLTEHQDISGKADKSELFSKDYNDLTNKPIIPVVDVDKEYVDSELSRKIDNVILTDDNSLDFYADDILVKSIKIEGGSQIDSSEIEELKNTKIDDVIVDAQDGVTYIKFFANDEIVKTIEIKTSSDSLIHVGADEPTADNCEVWIDVSDDEEFSSKIEDSLVTEIRTVISTLQSEIDKLKKIVVAHEARIEYLELNGGGSSGGSGGDDEDNSGGITTRFIPMTFEDGEVLVFEDNTILTFEDLNY